MIGDTWYYLLASTCRVQMCITYQPAYIHTLKKITACLTSAADFYWHAVSFTWQSLKMRFSFSSDKIIALLGEVSTHCPCLTNGILKTLPGQSCCGLDLTWIWEGHQFSTCMYRFFWFPRQVVIPVDNDFFSILVVTFTEMSMMSSTLVKVVKAYFSLEL